MSAGNLYQQSESPRVFFTRISTAVATGSRTTRKVSFRGANAQPVGKTKMKCRLGFDSRNGRKDTIDAVEKALFIFGRKMVIATFLFGKSNNLASFSIRNDKSVFFVTCIYHPVPFATRSVK